MVKQQMSNLVLGWLKGANDLDSEPEWAFALLEGVLANLQ